MIKNTVAILVHTLLAYLMLIFSKFISGKIVTIVLALYSTSEMSTFTTYESLINNTELILNIITMIMYAYLSIFVHKRYFTRGNLIKCEVVDYQEHHNLRMGDLIIPIRSLNKSELDILNQRWKMNQDKNNEYISDINYWLNKAPLMVVEMKIKSIFWEQSIFAKELKLPKQQDILNVNDFIIRS